MGAFRIRHCLCAAAIMAAAAVPFARADSQCRLCGTPTTESPLAESADDVRLEIETSLDFGRLILFGEGEGAAVIRPDGSSAASGTVGDVSARAMVGTATVHGEPGRAVKIELPHQIDLYSIGGARIRVEEVSSDLPPIPHLDSAGNLSFRFGGRVHVTGTADGAYRGDLPITVEYQ